LIDKTVVNGDIAALYPAEYDHVRAVLSGPAAGIGAGPVVVVVENAIVNLNVPAVGYVQSRNVVIIDSIRVVDMDVMHFDFFRLIQADSAPVSILNFDALNFPAARLKDRQTEPLAPGVYYGLVPRTGPDSE